jgi:hypothetical protein
MGRSQLWVSGLRRLGWRRTWQVEKRTGGPRPAPTETSKIETRENRNPQNRNAGEPLLLRGLGFDAVVGQGEARLVAIGGVFVQHAFGNGLVDGRHRGL